MHCKTSPGRAACEGMREPCASLVKERDLRRALLTACSTLPRRANCRNASEGQTLQQARIRAALRVETWG